MHLRELRLVNFKNYKEAFLSFSEKINVLVGKNGSGKTNLLDAIHYLSITKSAFGSDPYSVRHGETFFSIIGTFVRNGEEARVFCAVQGGKKTVREDDNEYQKLSDHIGKYPIVMIAPDDTDLVREGGETRRRFFDSVLSQLDHHYLDDLIHYNQALRSRNGLLKMYAARRDVDHVALDAYDHILVERGTRLMEKRSVFVDNFLPVFRDYYEFIAGKETVSLDYNSQAAATPMHQGLADTRTRDLLVQRTTFGIHRDDYLFTLGGTELKRLGSQGQQKSFVIALKLAQFDMLKNTLKVTPLILLDDIFDKLDDIRIGKLLELIQNKSLGQLFVTDARPDRTATLLKTISAPARLFTIDSGQVSDSVDLSY